MPEPKPLLRPARNERASVQSWGSATKYRVATWVGAVLVLSAVCDYALALYPLGLGSAVWEMATLGAIVQGLPLFSIGVAAMWVSAGGLGRRWLLVAVGWGLLVVAVGLFAALALFLTDVPLALEATRGVARVGIYKLIARTLFLGLLFGAGYIIAGVLALRKARGKKPKEAVA